MLRVTLQNPEPSHSYGDGWTACRVGYRCRCGTFGELILVRTDDYPTAVAEAKAGRMFCGACEPQAVKAQANPVVRVATLDGATDAELDHAVHTTAREDELAGQVRWVLEEPAERCQ
jgi:hypothetical protein